MTRILDHSFTRPHSSSAGNGDPFASFDANTRLYQQNISPNKRLIFSSKSPNIARKDNYLSKPLLSSPTKLNVVTSDWNDENSFISKGNFPILSPPTQLNDLSHNNSSRNPCQSSPNRRSLKKSASTTTTDRFIPSRYSSSGKLFNEGALEQPKPTDSPSKHIQFQSNKIYQHSVAQVCGVNIDQKILQFQPAPPERKKKYTFSLGQNTLNDGLNNVLEISRLKNSNGITPTNALARARKVPTIPERILDAPGLVDDYYLSLLAWSSDNLLAVALENSVYIWQASIGSVNLLTTCDVLITSLSWSDDGSYLSIGKDNGMIEVWDIEDNTKLRTMRSSDTRIVNHAWSKHLITSGSRSGELYHSDVRIAKHIVSEMRGYHNAEVCGIKWRGDGNQFSTGGNDNIVNIWDARSSIPQFSKTTHTAAVKALSWCDYQSSLLATGGGTNDKYIHFWNTTTGARVNSINTGSQITSLNWGQARGTGLEIVATSGYPNNSISIYHYPTLQKTGEISNSHDGRILSSALSPDGITLATAAADENLKFWKIFDSPKSSGSWIGSGKSTEDGKDSALTNGGKQIRRVMTIR
ncbi:ubiquitin-protein transferase activating protein [Saccharomycopsis crataegensis]|uniref:Ubiquitin-protein transferase activating protein n=1 Tax=Saccharomycopsis crataegensis TaxID=43959 RepID=A0AAV5QCY2_9ASCO|nr:ubiquitin-protein transferase activating protein [Saccharomycopsis crataegensis]